MAIKTHKVSLLQKKSFYRQDAAYTADVSILKRCALGVSAVSFCSDHKVIWQGFALHSTNAQYAEG